MRRQEAGVEKLCDKEAAVRPGYPRISWEEQLKLETDCTTQGSSMNPEKSLKASKSLTVGVVVGGETPILTGEFAGEATRPTRP